LHVVVKLDAAVDRWMAYDATGKWLERIGLDLPLLTQLRQELVQLGSAASGNDVRPSPLGFKRLR